MAVPDHDTMDMFPDMPRDPVPDREDQLPQDVKDLVKWLCEQAKQNARPLSEQLHLKKAADLLVEAWTGGTP